MVYLLQETLYMYIVKQEEQGEFINGISPTEDSVYVHCKAGRTRYSLSIVYLLQETLYMYIVKQE